MTTTRYWRLKHLFCAQITIILHVDEAFYRYTELGMQTCCLGQLQHQDHTALTTYFVWSGNLLGIWAGRSDGERDHVTGS